MSRLLRTSRVLLWLLLAGLSLGIMITASFYLYLRPGLPSVEQLTDIQLQTPLRVFSADNRLIAEFGETRRAPVTIEQIPTIQLHAFLAAEDSRFYEHIGVDFKGLLRAAIELVTTGEIQSGGSTITMQVAKNYFLSRDRTFIRKFNEILLALQIDRELPKNKILELYLNKIYLGNRAYGIESAAQVYYDKHVNELSLAQMAMLAGLPKAPSAYNPIANPQRALSRRNWILGRMRDLGYITPDAFTLASAAPVTASYNGPSTDLDADYVAEMARSEMVRRYGDAAYTDGYKVTLTVNSERQRAATKALRDGLEAYDHRHGFRGPVGQINKATLESGDLNDALSHYARVESLYPAVVTGIKDNQVSLYGRELGRATMAFETMTWARRYKTENLEGPEPQQPSDVVAPGDVIYVKPLPVVDENNPDPTRMPDQPDTPRAVALSQVPDIQGALIGLNAKTGGIQALTGGYSFDLTKYNRAIQAKRQPGSNFKPFLYLSALEQGRTAATLYNDAPIVFDDIDLETTWRPQNSSGQFEGPTRLRVALYTSRNLVSIRLLRDIGIQTTLDYLKKLKIPTDNMPKNLSLALGSGTLSPMEVARGFAVIANGGYDVTPYLIESIRNSNNELLYKAPEVILCDQDCDNNTADTHNNGSSGLSPEVQPAPIMAKRLADPRAVFIMHSILRDVITKGTGQRAQALDRPDVGGKTGTTNEQRDTWFSGFNNDISATAWVGFDQPTPLGRGEYGSTAALPVWLEYMKTAMKDQPIAYMPQPNGIVSVRIDPKTGKRARPSQTDGIFELFREENAPPPLENSATAATPKDDSGNNLSQELF